MNVKAVGVALAGVVALGACMACRNGCSGELVLAENGRSDYVLVHPDNLATGDVFVVKDVAGLLSASIGRDFAVTNLSAAPAAKSCPSRRSPLMQQNSAPSSALPNTSVSTVTPNAAGKVVA